MPHLVTLPPNRSQSAEATQNPRYEAPEIFEQHREMMILATNFLEALCARLISETKGSTTLAVIADKVPLAPDQTE